MEITIYDKYGEHIEFDDVDTYEENGKWFILFKIYGDLKRPLGFFKVEDIKGIVMDYEE